MGTPPSRFLLVLLGIVVAALLVPAVFVSVYDPGSPLPRLPFEAQPNPFFGQGYAVSSSSLCGVRKEGITERSEVLEDDLAEWCKVSWTARRGPLDRKAGTFRFGVRFAYVAHDGAQLRRVRLSVTRDAAWNDGRPGERDDSSWIEVAQATAAAGSAAWCEGSVPADSVAFRVEAWVDGWEPAIWFSQHMLTAPTLLGRVYDEIAWRPPFAWLPDLR